MPSDVNRTLLVVGYGSLLSGYGLLAKRRGGGSKLIACDAFPVTLHNARRGLAKPSSHGHYLAMDLEPINPSRPITAEAGCDGDAAIGALGLVFEREWAAKIARREEYEPAKFLQLLDLADGAGRPLGEFLLAIAERTGFNLLAYRRALREMVDYTSHGYIFHPLPLKDGRVALAAIGSGFDGSGDPAVQSKRREFGMERLLSLPEALQVSTLRLDREGQTGYFVECLLGGLHGIRVTDLAGGLQRADELGPDFVRRLTALVPQELDFFLRATSLDHGRYQSAFPAARRVLQTLFG